MNRLRLFMTYLYVALIFGAAIILSIQIFIVEAGVDLFNFTISFVSLVVAVIAFDISLKTYVSIDSVNALNKMEGSLLENENYTTSLTSLLKTYNMTDGDNVGEAIFKDLEARFKKKSKSAIDFSGNLQYFMDLIVFFPYLFNSANDKQAENMERMENLLNLIEKRKNSLLAVSSGNLLLIEETVKLITFIMHYQRIINQQDYNVTSSILEIRGSVLKNAVSRTIYYNYLGLFYNKKAMNLLRGQIGNADLLEIKTLKQFIGNVDSYPKEELEIVKMYLMEAKKAFVKAAESCEDDVMWNGFIKFNDARTTFFMQIVGMDDIHLNWRHLMSEAIQTRKKLNLLIRDLIDTDSRTYLQEAFIFEEYLSKLVELNFLIATESDFIDSSNDQTYLAPNFIGLEKNPYIQVPYEGPFDRIQKYQMEILDHLKHFDRKPLLCN